MKDLSNSISTALSHKVAVTSAASNGTGVDLQGYESATVVVTIGAEGDTLSGSVFFEIGLEDLMITQHLQIALKQTLLMALLPLMVFS